MECTSVLSSRVLCEQEAYFTRFTTAVLTTEVNYLHYTNVYLIVTVISIL